MQSYIESPVPLKVKYRQSLSYFDKQMEQRKSVMMKKLQVKDTSVSNREDNDLWVKPSPNTEISQRQNFSEYELVQTNI